MFVVVTMEVERVHNFEEAIVSKQWHQTALCFQQFGNTVSQFGIVQIHQRFGTTKIPQCHDQAAQTIVLRFLARIHVQNADGFKVLLRLDVLIEHECVDGRLKGTNLNNIRV